ncbi:MAG: DUF1349 domain-containing protein [Pseudomonadota bacterium]
MSDFSTAAWINPPKDSDITATSVSITTEPNTDFWQRAYYGFRNDNAPALLTERTDNFSFTARAHFEYRRLFDQCGVILYLDSENWFKVSIEHETDAFSRLGSVVTNRGHSDWASSDIPTRRDLWYRVSRRGPDFLAESSVDGEAFVQMRVCHLHALGETTAEMGASDPPLPPKNSVRVGVYACSPGDSSFTATFTDLRFEPCRWRAHRG